LTACCTKHPPLFTLTMSLSTSAPERTVEQDTNVNHEIVYDDEMTEIHMFIAGSGCNIQNLFLDEREHSPRQRTNSSCRQRGKSTSQKVKKELDTCCDNISPHTSAVDNICALPSLHGGVPLSVKPKHEVQEM
jgi:hypothetical protein